MAVGLPILSDPLNPLLPKGARFPVPPVCTHLWDNHSWFVHWKLSGGYRVASPKVSAAYHWQKSSEFWAGWPIEMRRRWALRSVYEFTKLG